MNREIKFRAWIANNMQKVERLDEIGIHGEKSGFSWSSIDDENFALMQYTGLKDKNGAEIYEGDLISYKAEDMEQESTARVGFSGGSFVADFGGGFFFVNQIAKESRVIGNVYENPDLIK